MDFPQAVDATTNPYAAELLRRDVANVADWFERRRLHIDVDELYGELVGLLFGVGLGNAPLVHDPLMT